MNRVIYLCVVFIVITITNLKAQNLIGYYKLDGSAISFNSNINGEIFGNTYVDSNRFNRPNAALEFRGAGGHVTFPTSFDYAARTINFWVYIDTVNTLSNIFTIDNDNLNNGMVYVQIDRFANGNRLQFFGGNSTPVSINILKRKWYKITITNSNSLYSFYIDNILIGTRPSTNIHSATGYSGAILAANRTLSGVFNGKIDDLSIYDYAMDTSQIRNITQESNCDFNNLVNIYDTTYVTTLDTNYVTITDTNTVTVIDTNYVTITDTNFITITDTVFVSVEDTLIIDIFTSTSQNPINTIRVYPNPTKDFININNGNFSTINNYQYIIINSNGATMSTSVVNSTNTLINITTWPGGVYFLNIYDENSKLVEVKKIIINK